MSPNKEVIKSRCDNLQDAIKHLPDEYKPYFGDRVKIYHKEYGTLVGTFTCGTRKKYFIETYVFSTPHIYEVDLKDITEMTRATEKDIREYEAIELSKKLSIIDYRINCLERNKENYLKRYKELSKFKST